MMNMEKSKFKNLQEFHKDNEFEIIDENNDLVKEGDNSINCQKIQD